MPILEIAGQGATGRYGIQSKQAIETWPKTGPASRRKILQAMSDQTGKLVRNRLNYQFNGVR